MPVRDKHPMNAIGHCRWVLELHGEPSPSCAYLLNGDMADRGKYAVRLPSNLFDLLRGC